MTKRKTKKKILLNLLKYGLLAFFILFGLIALWSTTLSLPDLQNFEERHVVQSTKIYDRTGEILLYDVHGDIKRTVVPLSDISDYIQKATIAVEDKDFYEHNGVQVTAIIRAIWNNINAGNLLGGQGGSTITQQVIKNALLTTDKKVSRKIKEWVLAPRLESILSKEQILEIYLNEVPYGGNVYGIQEAALRFFGKEAKDLSLAESAYLAALPQAPTYYSPYGNHKDDLEKRKNYVLEEMYKIGDITEEEKDNAMNEEVNFERQEEFGIKAPHFVVYVRDQLEQKYGRDVIEEGGLKVITTLDWELQKEAEDIVLKYATENEEKFNAENGAIVATDPNNGEVLVMVGSRNYFDEEIDGNFNIATAERQPGSAFKPFVYAEAFNKGYLPNTVVFDLETEFSTSCSNDGEGCYKPGNYDDIFRGPITLRDALAQSVNIPAVKVLYLAGLRDSLNLAKKMGIETLTNEDQYGLTLVLGGGEVRPIDMAGAYSVFANGGIKYPETTILKVEDAHGDVLFKKEDESKRVLSEQTTRLINDVLSDNTARTPAFGSSSPLYFPNHDVAAKTGTTNDYRDAWIVGYTPYISVAAWAGNNDNSPMEKKVAGFVVAPMWNEFMQVVLEKYNRSDEFITPSDVMYDGIKPIIAGFWKGETIKIIDTAGVAVALPTGTTGEGIHSILHWVNKSNPTGEKPNNPSNDPQYYEWEKSVQEWVNRQRISDSVDINEAKIIEEILNNLEIDFQEILETNSD